MALISGSSAIPPNNFEIWYSPLDWRDFLGTGNHDWEYMGFGFWESE